MSTPSFKLVDELESIEMLCNDAGLALKRDGIVSQAAWRPICRANIKGKFIRERIREFRSGASRAVWAPMGDIDPLFGHLSQLWTEIAISIRNTPRINGTAPRADAPITVGEIRQIRDIVSIKRYRATQILLSIRTAGEVVAGPSESAEIRQVRGPHWWKDLGTKDPLYEPLREDGQQQQRQQSQEGGETPVRPQYSPKEYMIWVESIIPSSVDGAREQNAVIDYIATRHYNVWFGTNRRKQSGPSYSDKESGPLVFGKCTVYVPQTHKFGSLGSGWIVRKLRKIAGVPSVDDRIKVTAISSLDETEWIENVNAAIANWSLGAALVIVHGYNVTFDEAARRTAQIGFDLRIDGVVAFFSWPSRGRIFPYTSDEESVQIAEPHFVKFLQILAQTRGLQEINILAHSMGNRLLLRTMRSIAELNGRGELPVRIGQIILAAADVPTEVFDNHSAFYIQAATKRVTSYSCDRDVPLMASRFLHQRPRVGLEPPYILPMAWTRYRREPWTSMV